MTARGLGPLLLAGSLLAAWGCSRPVLTGPPRPPAVGDEEVGTASWYGHPYHGRRTASGEVYDMNELTAAHRTLPLGARLVVTNLDTGQVVEVRVNDRGPWVEGRILDLSYAAARVLGGVGPGLIPVRLRVIAPGAAAPRGAAAPPGAGWAVQLGAFTDRARAEALGRALEAEGSPAEIREAAVAGETFWRVRVGAFPDRASARAQAERLAARGYRPLVVER